MFTDIASFFIIVPAVILLSSSSSNIILPFRILMFPAIILLIVDIPLKLASPVKTLFNAMFNDPATSKFLQLISLLDWIF